MGSMGHVRELVHEERAEAHKDKLICDYCL
jgi:hypothetical protein